MDKIAPTERTQVKRLPDRGAYDRETIYRILDDAFVCHVGFVVEGQPYVIPTNFGRSGDVLYIHGSPASRMLRALSSGAPVCVEVTLIDGLVLARSGFHSSVNYRSVVILGRATIVEEPKEKEAALAAFSEHVLRGRWKEIRPPTDAELKGTTVLALPLDEASAKIRTGPPNDDEADYALPVWAGVLPLRIVAGEPIPDPRLNPGIPIPSYVRAYRR
jgi:nitroimidazol reductase NimA-like FMN-containing flavoprotein (pyridoxamine 5'-phosphate oxidase superfamily)